MRMHTGQDTKFRIQTNTRRRGWEGTPGRAGEGGRRHLRGPDTRYFWAHTLDGVLVFLALHEQNKVVERYP